MRLWLLVLIAGATVGPVVRAQGVSSIALTPTEAAGHRGETITVCGFVAQVSCDDTGMTLRVDNFDPKMFQFFIPAKQRIGFDANIAHQVDEQAVCATGKVEGAKGGSQIMVATPSALTLNPNIPARPPRFGPDVHYGCEPGATHTKMTHSELPRYPARAVAQRLGGTVYVKAVVNPDGMVDEAVVMRGLDAEFDAETLNAVKRFRFAPGTVMGVSVRSVVVVEMEFSPR